MQEIGIPNEQEINDFAERHNSLVDQLQLSRQQIKELDELLDKYLGLHSSSFE
ncbi:MAG: hypothetical protein LBL83_01845 [Clostridiales bacterium]|jgi:hypothetical protein|nr:hypothetical protein [Clostridiales bacterium]